MKATEKPVYIAVRCTSSGECFLIIDAHEKGYKGTLTPGIIEARTVKFKEILNYLYLF